MGSVIRAARVIESTAESVQETWHGWRSKGRALGK